MDGGIVYRVLVSQNLVTAVDLIEGKDVDGIATENLEVALKLAENYRETGTIDGEYFFSGIHRAKDFSLLALDFVKKLMEKSEQNLKAHNFYSQPNWYNPSVKRQQDLQH